MIPITFACPKTGKTTLERWKFIIFLRLFWLLHTWLFKTGLLWMAVRTLMLITWTLGLQSIPTQARKCRHTHVYQLESGIAVQFPVPWISVPSPQHTFLLVAL